MKKRAKLRLISLLLCVLLLLLCACGQSGQSTATRDIPEVPAEENIALGYIQQGLSPYKVKESGAVFEDGPVTFQDPVVEGWLRGFLGKPEGEVLRSDLQAIHAIYIVSDDMVFSNLQSEDGFPPPLGKERDEWTATLPPFGQPETLADLALCDNLQYFELSRSNQPVSLEPLAALPQLQRLYLPSEVLNDQILAELALLPHLTDLHISWQPGEPLPSLDFLLPLADRLELLKMSYVNPDTAVLAQMKKLKTLSIDMPENLDFLPELPALERLDLRNDLRHDPSYIDVNWSEVPWPDTLVTLNLGFSTNYQPDITVADLQRVPNLRYLSLGNIGNITLTRYQLAAQLPNLEGLDLH